MDKRAGGIRPNYSWAGPLPTRKVDNLPQNLEGPNPKDVIIII